MKIFITHLLLITTLFFTQSRNKPIQFHLNNCIKPNDSWFFLGKMIAEPTENATAVLKIVNPQKIKKIRINVTKGGINLKKCEVWLIDGSKKTIELRNDLSEGEESREMEIGSYPIIIDKIVINYDTRNHDINRSELELWGKSE